ncbi:MAG: hypothetical protein LQ339_007906 [Xanthoria mediterranea]|nr:MAG: hypothetical protein LQ339_007906 [Xanthoria mediterranea]
MKRVNLCDEDPLLVKIMLEFLYTQRCDLSTTFLGDEVGDYDDGDDKDCKIRSLDDIIALYALGDKYGIPSLCPHASHDFQKTICDLRDTPQRQLIPDILLGCIPQVYTSTPDSDRTLKDFLVKEMIHGHCSSSSAGPDGKALLEAMEDNAQFRKDMTVGLLEKEKAKEKAKEHDAEFEKALASVGEAMWDSSSM